MNLTDLKRKPVAELVEMAQEMGLENLARSRKQEVIAAILRKQAKNGEGFASEMRPSRTSSSCCGLRVSGSFGIALVTATSLA